jgi:hypothetical protein
MRFPTIWTITLLLAAGAAAAAWAGGPPANPDPAMQLEPPVSGLQGSMTVLASPEVEKEIREVIEKATAEEARLLAALVAATDEAECQAVIEQIQALDLRRDLAILRIQARCAQNRGLYELEHRILVRIEELSKRQFAAVQ